MMEIDQRKLDELDRHADAFLQSGMGSWSGHFPDNFAGKQAAEYYRWSKKAYALIKALKHS